MTLSETETPFVRKCTVGLARTQSQRMQPLRQPKLRSFALSNLSSSPTTTTRCTHFLFFFFLPVFFSILGSKDSKHLRLFFWFSLLWKCFSYTNEALEVNTKLLEINPEYSTAWNFRKLAVEHRLRQSDSDPDSIKSIFSEELKVVVFFIAQFLFSFLFVCLPKGKTRLRKLKINLIWFSRIHSLRTGSNLGWICQWKIFFSWIEF